MKTTIIYTCMDTATGGLTEIKFQGIKSVQLFLSSTCKGCHMCNKCQRFSMLVLIVCETNTMCKPVSEKNSYWYKSHTQW
jgi:hypothetical protein